MNLKKIEELPKFLAEQLKQPRLETRGDCRDLEVRIYHSGEVTDGHIREWVAEHFEPDEVLLDTRLACRILIDGSYERVLVVTNVTRVRHSKMRCLIVALIGANNPDIE